jgi:hypothetical protein
MGFGAFDRGGGLREGPLEGDVRSIHRKCPLHGSGWPEAHVRRHENGHARVARALGRSATVNLRKGETYVYGRGTPIEEAAIDYGGWAAAGYGGHELDFSAARSRGLSWAEDAQARRIARRYA